MSREGRRPVPHRKTRAGAARGPAPPRPQHAPLLARLRSLTTVESMLSPLWRGEARVGWGEGTTRAAATYLHLQAVVQQLAEQGAVVVCARVRRQKSERGAGGVPQRGRWHARPTDGEARARERAAANNVLSRSFRVRFSRQARAPSVTRSRKLCAQARQVSFSAKSRQAARSSSSAPRQANRKSSSSTPTAASPITSRGASAGNAATGTPLAKASSSTSPNVSVRLGNTKTSADA